MIDTTLLEKMFKSNFVKLISKYEIIDIRKNTKNITIYSNYSYLKNLSSLEEFCNKRKNCWVIKKSYKLKPHIYFHEDYIRSIIRQKTINILLND